MGISQQLQNKKKARGARVPASPQTLHSPSAPARVLLTLSARTHSRASASAHPASTLHPAPAPCARTHVLPLLLVHRLELLPHLVVLLRVLLLPLWLLQRPHVPVCRVHLHLRLQVCAGGGGGEGQQGVSGCGAGRSRGACRGAIRACNCLAARLAPPQCGPACSAGASS